MNIFLVNPSKEDTFQLNEEESFHCVRVLRHKGGDVINMVDGSGTFYKGEIIHADSRASEVKVLAAIRNFGKRSCRLHIAIAPTKNVDRIEWFLEKATEIGIDEITPVICEHSERKIIKPERLNKVLVSAMKQSIKAFLPRLNSSVSFGDFVSGQLKGEAGSGKRETGASIPQKFICSCDEGKESLLKNIYVKDTDAVILVGPEGDFSEEEINRAVKAGFKTVSLGESRLRTETAGVVACHTVQLLNQ